MKPISPRERLLESIDPLVYARNRGFDADEHQARILRTNARRSILCCTRQFGKSHTIACKAAWVAEYRPGSLAVITSPSDRQSIELLEKVRKYLGHAPRANPRKDDNKRDIRLSNGSVIRALPGSPDTVRGLTPNIVLVDEAAFCDPELFPAITPSLAVSKGQLLLASTPNGRSGPFFDTWSKGTGWEKILVTAADCPRISQEHIDAEREIKPTWQIRQEYYCEFVADEWSVFSPETIESCLDDDIEPLNIGVRWR